MEFSSVRPRYESVRAARLDSAADCLLPDDSWHQQSQASGVSSTQHMIFSDECSISPPLFMCVGGISRQGATEICIFDGIMGADLFCNVLETTLILFIIIIKVTSTSSCRIMT